MKRGLGARVSVAQTAFQLSFPVPFYGDDSNCSSTALLVLSSNSRTEDTQHPGQGHRVPENLVERTLYAPVSTCSRRWAPNPRPVWLNHRAHSPVVRLLTRHRDLALLLTSVIVDTWAASVELGSDTYC